VTAAAGFGLAATFLISIGLATGITLRTLHRRPDAPMLGLMTAGAVLQAISRLLYHDWPDVFWGLGIIAICLGLLTWDARKGAQ